MQKKYARIVGGVVAEVFETDQDIAELFHPDLHWVLASSAVSVGDLCDGINFSKPVPPIFVPSVPEWVTRYQARAALYKAGLLDDVEHFMALPDTDRLLVLAWQDAQTFKRHSPMVIDLGKVLGLTAMQIDELFIAASAIE